MREYNRLSIVVPPDGGKPYYLSFCGGIEHRCMHPANRSEAIHLKCKSCEERDPETFAHCGHNGCPLYRVRNLNLNHYTIAQGVAIREYCKVCERANYDECPYCDEVCCVLFLYQTGKDELTVKVCEE